MADLAAVDHRQALTRPLIAHVGEEGEARGQSCCVFSAKGADFSLAWGGAPGTLYAKAAPALKARFISAGFRWPEGVLSRAFSALHDVLEVLGRCPRLGMKQRLQRYTHTLPLGEN